jgi:hypothetical protein
MKLKSCSKIKGFKMTKKDYKLQNDCTFHCIIERKPPSLSSVSVSEPKLPPLRWQLPLYQQFSPQLITSHFDYHHNESHLNSILLEFHKITKSTAATLALRRVITFLFFFLISSSSC